MATTAGDGGPATAASLASPAGVAVDESGHVYIADTENNRVRRVTTAGLIDTVAGRGSGSLGDGGPAVSATLNGPAGLALGRQGALYIADVNNHRVRMVNAQGVISTVAGTGAGSYTGDNGQATAATLNQPVAVALDGSGNLYIADRLNNRVRKVNSAGVITTAAGNGNGNVAASGDGGPATAAVVRTISGVAIDSTGNLIINAPTDGNIRQVNSAGIISTIAGNGVRGYAGDGVLALSAQMGLAPAGSYFGGLAAGANGAIYLADWANQVVRQIVPNAPSKLTILSGDKQSGATGAALGSALVVSVAGPTGVAVAGATVTFTVTSGAATLSANSGVTSSSGQCGVGVTFGGTAGPVTVTASVAGLTPVVFTLTASVATTTGPAITDVLNGASFEPGMAPNAWIVIRGTGLYDGTPDTWDRAIVNGNLPTKLDGVSVSIGGQPAYVYYVSATQINAVTPNLAAGRTTVTVTNGQGTTSAATVTVQATQPAFFPWPDGYVVATRADYTYAIRNGEFSGISTSPAKPGEVIILWGTGFGATQPAAPAGVAIPPTQTYSTASPVMVTVGGIPATVYAAVLSPGAAALYQLAVQIPSSLGSGDYPVIATVSGASSPASAMITVQQ